MQSAPSNDPLRPRSPSAQATNNLTQVFVRATDIGTTYVLHTTWGPGGEETWLRLRH